MSADEQWPRAWRKRVASVALSADELEALDRLCASAGQTRSTVLRNLVLDLIDEEERRTIPPTTFTW